MAVTSVTVELDAGLLGLVELHPVDMAVASAAGSPAWSGSGAGMTFSARPTPGVLWLVPVAVPALSAGNKHWALWLLLR